MELQPKLDALNKDLDQVNEGSVPARFVKTSTSLEEYQQIQKLQSYIRRYKNQIPKAKTLKQKQNWESLLDKYQTELSQLI